MLVRVGWRSRRTVIGCFTQAETLYGTPGAGGLGWRRHTAPDGPALGTPVGAVRTRFDPAPPRTTGQHKLTASRNT